MKRFLALCLITLLPALSFAQHKKASPKKNNPKTATSKVVSTSQETPKQVPGTEGQKTHPEAKINSPLPSFQLATPEKIFLTEKDIPKNNSVIFALFNPTCDHCIIAAKDIKSKLNNLKNTSVYFMTFTSNFNELKSFIDATGVAQYPNFHVCVAEEKFILSHFMPNYIMPQIMVYNKQHKLQKIFYEKVEMERLESLLNQ